MRETFRTGEAGFGADDREEDMKEAEGGDVLEAIAEGRWLETDIRSKTEQLQTLREAAERITAMIGQDRGTSPMRHDAMEKAIVSMVDLEGEISREICRQMEVQKQLMAAFNRVKHQGSRTVLQMRYLNRKPWQEIADKLDISLHTAYRMHRIGMQELRGMAQGKKETTGTAD